MRATLSSRTDLIEWFNEAEEEACLRKRLIRVGNDDATLCIIDVTAPTSIYALHPKLAWVTPGRLHARRRRRPDQPAPVLGG